MHRPLFRHLASLLLALCTAAAAASARAADTVVYEPPAGAADLPGKGRHVVFLAGDEEYRSEEGLPMLAKILSQRHGFRCTVLFPLDAHGTINPDNQKSLAGAEALDSADAIVMLVRFRAWPDEAMKKFIAAYQRGVPIVALRTSTHPFRFPKDSPHASFNDFGKRVIGEGWVSHWGKHKVEATRGVIEPAAKDDSILRGVDDVFGDSDVYEAYPPPDAKILLRGQVLKGMKPNDEPADYTKKRASDGKEQPVNDPMMPVAWTRVHRNDAGKENRIFCTTMGAATDLQSEGLRRLVINGVYWGLGLDVPAKADVSYVGDYKPTVYGFKGFVKGVKPADHALNATPSSPSPGTPGEGGGEGSAQAPSSVDRSATAPNPHPALSRSTGRGGSQATAAAATTTAAASRLELKPGDHVAIIGNVLADRMQHHGHLETLIHARFPDHELVFRNLAFPGDEINFRHRSQNFGSPDEWLTKTKADVIFAFFGFNESFKGEAGLPAFRAELDKLLKQMRSMNYSGKGPPRIVLFSPIADERHRDPNYPDPAANNARIALYAKTMADVADANGVQFVDLFAPSQSLYADAARRGESLTINGHYLAEAGDKLLAPLIFTSLFAEPAPAADLEKLRAAVNEKNRQWHARYRTVDGYNVYGGRSQLSFPSSRPGEEIKNFHVMQEEMSQRDVLTANRDKKVWAVAQGGDLEVDDSNLPPVTQVPTNRPGEGPGGAHQFVGGEDAIAKMKPHANTTINLFASEKEFPDLVNPVQMAWDTRGRLWVSAWRNYPERTPTSKVGDKLLIFEDTNADGRADKQTVYLDDLNCPTGFQFYKDGVLVMQAPDLWFVRDTDGDGRADTRERVLMGMDSADSHHTANSLAYEPGGAIYLSDGVFHRTQVETHAGVTRNDDGAIYRFEPRTGNFETHIAYGFANPHGRVFDYWGNDIVTDATNNRTYFAPAFSGRLDYPHKHRELREFWDRPARPSPGTGLMTSRHFPDDFFGNFLNMNVIGFQGIYRVKVVEDGSGLRGERLADLVSSEDPNFRPTAVNVGPDGAVYFADWHNPIIGHMQHHIRDPNRDHAHGRIYRMTYTGRPLATPPKIHGQPIAALLELLKEPENQTRELAKIELDKHDSRDVLAAAKKWADALDESDPAYEHHMTELLWLHQWHNVVDRELLGRMLESPEPRARAQATRVLCYWRDRVPEALALLRARATDSHPRVRLEAVRAASFFRSAEAADVALAALKRHAADDYYIGYTLGETIRQLEPHWRGAIADGEPVAADNPAGFDFLMAFLPADDLLKVRRTPAVLQALLSRAEVPDAERHKVLAELAGVRGTTAPAALLDAVRATSDAGAQANLVKILPQLLPRDLKPLRARLAALATGDGDGDGAAPPRTVRQYAWAALATADESFDQVWPAAAAARSPEALADLLAAVPLVYDPFIRARAYDRVLPLLEPSASATAVTTTTTTATASPTRAERAERAARLAVRRNAIAAAVSINREAPRTFAALAALIERGQDVPAAATGLRALPRTAIRADRAPAVTAALLDWARKVPPDDRTDRDYLAAVQLAEALVPLLPPPRAAEVLKDLRTLRVAVFVVGTVREQMRYDTPRLVVEAGKPFQIRFENTDLMPHNLVVVTPGSRRKVGETAAKMKPDQRDAEGRQYVPALPEVLAATKLLENGRRATLRLTAPETEGDYEYVCTYPDHWPVMWGKLIVTKDIDAYLRSHPEQPAPTTTAAEHKHAHR